MQKVLFAVLAACLISAAADLPYAGKWKMNPAKSDFGDITVTFTAEANGGMQMTADGQSYSFKMDGKDYPAMFGQTAAWKQIDGNNWETIDKMNSKVISTDKTTVSADGKMLTLNSRGQKPDGGTMDDTLVYQRVSGGPGLPGKWKAKNYKSAAPSMLELTAAGEDGLKFLVVDQKLSCDVKLDGKDYPCSGPNIASGWTMAARKSGARGLEITDKQNGKPLYQASFTVSADGKTLTESGGAVGVMEKYKVVYDRQ